MRRVLCIITSEDSFTEKVISQEKEQPNCSVEVFRLGESADYETLLDRILEAESVQVW